MRILLAVDGSDCSDAPTRAVIAQFPREKTEVPSEWHPDLIVLGSHGRRGVDRFLLGSVSEGVVRHAPCSVEVVRAPSNRR